MPILHLDTAFDPATGRYSAHLAMVGGLVLIRGEPCATAEDARRAVLASLAVQTDGNGEAVQHIVRADRLGPGMGHIRSVISDSLLAQIKTPLKFGSSDLAHRSGWMAEHWHSGLGFLSRSHCGYWLRLIARVASPRGAGVLCADRDVGNSSEDLTYKAAIAAASEANKPMPPGYHWITIDTVARAWELFVLRQGLSTHIAGDEYVDGAFQLAILGEYRYS